MSATLSSGSPSSLVKSMHRRKKIKQLDGDAQLVPCAFELDSLQHHNNKQKEKWIT